jgi:oxygen-independent coproporphyrinogen-3 oxidase
MHLYIHVPFCGRRCSYCDFAIAVRRTVPSQAFVDTVSAEWDMWRDAPIWSSSNTLSTVYLGGGTPSLLEPAALARLLAHLVERKPLVPDAEVTLEVNPDDVTLLRARDWRALGVNRISLGAQSFANAALQWMHRTHGSDQIGRAMDTLRRAGFDNVSLDLIFGLPNSLGRDWQDDLTRALALEPTHLSLYGLTIEPHTPLARWVTRGSVTPVDDTTYASEFLEGHRALSEAGFDHYEVSNASRPGFRSRHNSAYWRRSTYLGLGPSAHSAWQDHRQWNVREWEAYRGRVAVGGEPMEGAEELGPGAVALEAAYLGLRTSEGLATESVPEDLAGLWQRAGWARIREGRVRLTAEGWLRLDALVGEVAQAGLNYPV